MKFAHVIFFSYWLLLTQEYVPKKKLRCRHKTACVLIASLPGCLTGKNFFQEVNMMVLHRVLQDTRDSDNPNVCASCGGVVSPLAFDSTNTYSIHIYECKQCGAVSSLLTEIYLEDETFKTAKA